MKTIHQVLGVRRQVRILLRFFFNLINELHDRASLIITTNKSPAEWADVLNDTVLKTAILDRVLHSATTLITHNAFEQKPTKLTWINNGYQLVLFLSMSLIIGLFQ